MSFRIQALAVGRSIMLTDKETVSLLKRTYKGVDRSLAVKVRHKETYGVDWINDAKVLILGHAPETPQKPPGHDTHRLRHSIRCRVTESKKEGVHRAIMAFRFPSCQPTEQNFVDLATSYVLEHQEEFQKWMDERKC